MITNASGKWGSFRCDIVAPNWSVFVSTVWFFGSRSTRVFKLVANEQGMNSRMQNIREFIWVTNTGRLRTREIHEKVASVLDAAGNAGSALDAAFAHVQRTLMRQGVSEIRT